MEKTLKVTGSEFKTSAKTGKRFKSVSFEDGSKYNWFKATPAFNPGETYRFLEVESGSYVNMDRPTLVDGAPPVPVVETASGIEGVCPYCGRGIHFSMILSAPMVDETM